MQKGKLIRLKRFRKVRKLVESGFTETQVKKTLGLTRGDISADFRMATMPFKIQAEYEKEDSHITSEDVNRLSVARSKDIRKNDRTFPTMWGVWEAIEQRNGKKPRLRSIEKLLDDYMPDVKHPMLLEFLEKLQKHQVDRELLSKIEKSLSKTRKV